MSVTITRYLVDWWTNINRAATFTQPFLLHKLIWPWRKKCKPLLGSEQNPVSSFITFTSAESPLPISSFRSANNWQDFLNIYFATPSLSWAFAAPYTTTTVSTLTATATTHYSSCIIILYTPSNKLFLSFTLSSSFQSFIQLIYMLLFPLCLLSYYQSLLTSQ